MSSTIKLEQYKDDEIVSKVLSGETALYELIIRRHNSYLFKIGRSYGYNHVDTEDLMQESHLKAYSNLKSFENRSSFKTWLVKIMLNQCYQKRQKFSYQKEISVENFIDENVAPMFSKTNPGSEKALINKELGHIVENALKQIPEDYRMVFSLRELNSMSTLETAHALDISESNVKIRLNRAKNMLRGQIMKMYSPDDIFEFNLIYCNRIVEIVMRILNKEQQTV